MVYTSVGQQPSHTNSRDSVWLAFPVSWILENSGYLMPDLDLLNPDDSPTPGWNRDYLTSAFLV